METLESALQLMLSNITPLQETEILPLHKALHRVLAEDLVSPIDVPSFDRSPLDGYALCSEDIKGASEAHPVTLRVIGEADAGCGTAFHPARGEALRIMTGAPVPAECDCVIRQEMTDQGMETAAFYVEEKHNANICRRGEDIAKGSVLIRAGEKLSPAHLGVIASVGIPCVRVYRQPRVALLCTGDELLQPGEPLSYGRIYDSSKTHLALRLTELGADVDLIGSVADDPALAAEKLLTAIKDADLVITTGGVSVGKKDIMHQVLPLMGAERLYWKLSLKPGMPTLCGKLDGKLIICLSGNPFSASVCFELLAVPCLRTLMGCSAPASAKPFTAPLANGFQKASRIRRMIRGRFDGGTVFVPDNQSNSALASLMGCNCYVDIPAGSGILLPGEQVTVIMLETC